MTIILLLILTISALLANKYIRKYFNVLLSVSAVLSIVALVFQTEIFSFVNDGYLGLAFFIIVMYAGAFKKGDPINKKLRSIRKEYSILGFITLMPHNIIFILYYLDGTLKVEWLGIIAVLIMIPLFLTSFSSIKKKMAIKNWVKLQKFSYLAYITIYIHLMLIGEEEHKVIYTIIFGVYSILKLYSSIVEKSYEKSIVSGISILVITVTLLFISPIVLDDNQTDNINVVGEVDVDVIEIEIDDSGEYTDGVFDGYSSGFQNMDVYVQVTVENGVIISIEIIEYGSTGSHGGTNFREAAKSVRDEVLNTQSIDVDTVSGATYTTTGLINAIKDALDIS